MARTQRIKRVRDVTTVVADRFTQARSPSGILGPALEPHLSPGSVLEGVTGHQAVRAARASLETHLASTLAGRDALTLFLAARCISPRIWASLGPVGDEVQPSVRSVLELGIQKYGAWKPSPRDLTAMPAFLPAHLAVIGRAFALSEAYGTLLAIQRRIAKGQPQRVISTAPLDLEVDDIELDRLISRLDRRYTGDTDPLMAYGTISRSDRAAVSIPFILAARLVQPSEVIDEGGAIAVEPRSDGSAMLTADRVTRWGFIEDIEEFQRSVAAYDASMRAAAGSGLIDLHAIQHLVSIAILEAHQGRDLPSPLEVLGIAEVPAEVGVLWRDIAGTHPYDQLDPALVPTPTSLSNAFNRLVVDPAAVDLSNPTVRRPLIHLGERTLIYDLSAASLFTPLFLEGQLTDIARKKVAKDFEARTHATLAPFGNQPWPSGRKLKAGGRTLTDVDASVQLGSTLVVVDCYSSAWSHPLDLGENSKVRNRADHLMSKIEEWQRQWSEIATRHRSLLPSDVYSILPVVVTAGPEWIPSTASHLWLDDAVPTILTAPELTGLIERKRLSSLPNTIPVP